jgi:hypothetical protein
MSGANAVAGVVELRHPLLVLSCLHRQHGGNLVQVKRSRQPDRKSALPLRRDRSRLW